MISRYGKTFHYHLQLIDFGRCIDLNLLPNARFTTSLKGDTRCVAMRQQKPWSYDLDHYSAAATISGGCNFSPPALWKKPWIVILSAPLNAAPRPLSLSMSHTPIIILIGRSVLVYIVKSVSGAVLFLYQADEMKMCLFFKKWKLRITCVVNICILLSYLTICKFFFCSAVNYYLITCTFNCVAEYSV